MTLDNKKQDTKENGIDNNDLVESVRITQEDSIESVETVKPTISHISDKVVQQAQVVEGEEEVKPKESEIKTKLEDGKTLQDILTTEPRNSDTKPILSNSSTVQQLKKKETNNKPLFSRSNTTDKVTNKNMIVETETVDASSTPSVTLPIASTSTVINNEIISTINSTINNNLSSLRSKKSTLFVDQQNNTNNQTITPISNSIADDSDAISIAGSIRNKKLNSLDNHLNVSNKGATKADLFAAKIANAVGDASDSDSEETFVYESAPDALNSSNTLPAGKSPAVALGLSNPVTLRKKAQRNISMPLTTSNLNPNHSSLSSSIGITMEDNKEQQQQLQQQQHQQQLASSELEKTQQLQQKFGDDQSFSRFHYYPSNISETDESETNHLQSISDNSNKESTISTQDTILKKIRSDTNVSSQAQNSQEVLPQQSEFDNVQEYHQKLRNATPIQSPKTHEFTKYKGPKRTPKKPAPNLLRSASSKLFDVKSQRKLSGIPDHFSMDDDEEQFDEEHSIGHNGPSYSFRDGDDDEEEDDDDELTPLRVSNLKRNMKNKISGYQVRRNYTNFGPLEQGYSSFDSLTKRENELRHSNSKVLRNGRKQKSKSQFQHSPHNFFNSKKNSKLQIFRNCLYVFTLCLLILMFGFITGFLLATTKDLQHVKLVSVQNALVSYDELIFDIYVQAFNPGFFSVQISNVDIDLFAKTAEITDGVYEIEYLDRAKSPETILLGTVSKLERPLEFSGGFFTRNPAFSKGEIKLIHPGQNATDDSPDSDENHKIDDESDKWKKIIKSPFELILRGQLKYNLPFFHSERSITVTKSVLVDPINDK